MSAALLLTLMLGGPAAAQDPAHAVTVNGAPALRFASENGRHDVTVRATAAPDGSRMLTFDVILMTPGGKASYFCSASVKFDLRLVRFALEGKNRKECKALNGAAISLAEVRDADIGVLSAQWPTTRLQFRAGNTVHRMMLRPSGDFEMGPGTAYPSAAYEFLLLALVAPEAALAKFDTLTDSSTMPRAASRPADDVYASFFNQRRTDPDAAYTAGKVYLDAMSGKPDTPEIQLVRSWIAAYEKVKGINR
jgi:hypothetical protein